jgi:phosphoglycerate kinase
MGRPKEGPEEKSSLKNLIAHLEQSIGVKVQFANDCISEESFKLSAVLEAGQVLLLENLRFYKEEEKGDEGFAEKLSKHGDVYVNDAFGTAHRAHASTAVIAKFFAPENRMFGLLMEGRITNEEFEILTGAEPTEDNPSRKAWELRQQNEKETNI